MCNTDAATEVEMTFVTANVGRDYNTKPSAVAAFDKIGDFMDARKGPRFVGWQEIGESDPCGACEWDALNARFKATAGWDNRRPAGKRPDGNNETVKVPVSAKDADGKAPVVRAVYASAGWAGVSPTRFVTVVYYPERNLSFINTHLIAGAWSCKSEVEKRKDYWRDGWKVLKAEVAEIAQEAGWRATHVISSVRTGKNDRENGAREARAVLGDRHRTLKRLLSADRAPRLPLGEQSPDGGRDGGRRCAPICLSQRGIPRFPTLP